MSSNKESSDLAKRDEPQLQARTFDVEPDAFDRRCRPSTPTPPTTSTAAAKYEKKGAFTARLTAIVVDTLPNGNLVVSGRREIRIDNETKLIEFTGIVRRFDIQADNTVQSELVANAEVVYRGSGPMTRQHQPQRPRRLVHDAIAWLWPF